MQAVTIAMLIWAMIVSFLLIAALQKARMNEKRIFVIDEYLKKRIRQETGQTIYKDVR